MSKIFMKFFVIGGFGFFIDMLVTWLLKEKVNLNRYLANSIGFIVGNVFRFHFNKIWAFEDASPDWEWQLFKFMFIAFIGLLQVNYTIYLIHEKYQKFSFYNAKIIALILFMFVNFYGNYFWTFEH